MSTSIRFNPNHFAAVPYEPAQEIQTVWHQLDKDAWLRIEIGRNQAGYSTAPYVKEATLMRQQRSTGGWQSAYTYTGHVSLLEDASAAAQLEPKPAPPVANTGSAYIAQRYSNSAPEERPDVFAVRHKNGIF